MAKLIGDNYEKFHKALLDLKASKGKLKSLVKIIKENK